MTDPSDEPSNSNPLDRISPLESALLVRLAAVDDWTVLTYADDRDAVIGLIEEGLVDAELRSDGAMRVRLRRG